MKIRMSFVSNSSSSSFIVVGKEPQILNYEVPKSVAKRIISYVKDCGHTINWDEKSPVFVTQDIREEQVEVLGWENYAPYEDSFEHSEEYHKVVISNLDGEVRIRKEHLIPSFTKKEFKRRVKELAKEFKVKYKLDVK